MVTHSAAHPSLDGTVKTLFIDGHFVATAVMADMQAIRRVIHDFHLFQVKTPAQPHGDWDVYRLISTVPAADAFRSLSEGGCPLAK